MVRLAREGKEGTFVRNKLMQFMWLDVDKRTRKLGVSAVYFRVHTGCCVWFIYCTVDKHV